jgi:hypothetical protein
MSRYVFKQMTTLFSFLFPCFTGRVLQNLCMSSELTVHFPKLAGKFWQFPHPTQLPGISRAATIPSIVLQTMLVSVNVSHTSGQRQQCGLHALNSDDVIQFMCWVTLKNLSYVPANTKRSALHIPVIVKFYIFNNILILNSILFTTHFF